MLFQIHSRLSAHCVASKLSIHQENICYNLGEKTWDPPSIVLQSKNKHYSLISHNNCEIMRLRIRGPSGQSTVTLADEATIEDLKRAITTQTSLSAFDVKYSYPPKPLSLDHYEPSKPLSQLDIKLNGEQLLVTRAESALANNDKSTQAQSGPGSSNDAVSRGPPKDAASSVSRTQPTNKAVASASASKESQPAPLSLTRRENKDMSDPPEIPVPNLGGTLVLRIMPDDNSCLFRAIASAVISDLDAVTELRSVVAETIQADQVTYNKAVLDDKEPDSYCRWIKNENSWGGQVELVILAKHFDVEICSIDVQTLRIDRYNEGAATRCFVVYSGIHYDTIALTLPGMPPEQDVKVFTSPFKDEILPKAKDLCLKLQEKHYFTDTSGFQLKCNQCGTQLKGEKAAMQHAQSTGHTDFGEA